MSKEQVSTEGTPITPEELPSTINKLSEGLQARITAAKQEAERLERERAENVKKQVSERESLIASGIKLDVLIADTKRTIESFKEAEKLFDERAEQEFAELKKLFSLLEKQRREINEQVDTLTTQPGVKDALFDAANQDNIKFDNERKIQQFLSEVRLQINELGKEAFQTIQRRGQIIQKINHGSGDLEDGNVTSAHEKVKEVYNEVKKLIGTPNTLFTLVKEAATADQLRTTLEERRKNFGVLKKSHRLHKKAIDVLLASDYLAAFQCIKNSKQELHDRLKETENPSSPDVQRIVQSLVDIEKKSKQIDWKEYKEEGGKHEFWSSSNAPYFNFVKAVRLAAEAHSYKFHDYEVGHIKDAYEKLLREEGLQGRY